MSNTSYKIRDWFLFPKCQVFLPASVEIVESMTTRFFESIERGEEMLPMLRPLGEMNLDDAGSFISLIGKYGMVCPLEVTANGITAQVQERSDKRAKPKRVEVFYFGQYNPAQVQFLLRNSYDLFGWIDDMKAITQSKAEDMVWRETVKFINDSPVSVPLNNPNIDDGSFGQKIYGVEIKGLVIKSHYPEEGRISFKETFDHDQHKNYDIG